MYIVAETSQASHHHKQLSLRKSSVADPSNRCRCIIYSCCLIRTERQTLDYQHQHQLLRRYRSSYRQGWFNGERKIEAITDLNFER